MSRLLPRILNKIDLSLDEDISRLNITILGDKKGFASYQKQQREFVKYLVSVVTHPIGLRASVKPYNCCQEDMLIYLMDMFNLTESKLRAIILGKSRSKFKQKDDQSPISLVKRHSWRPELKIRIHPPAFFYKEQLFLDNLYVRVYLIKEEKIGLAEPEVDLGNSHDAKSKGILKKIFRNLHSTSSNFPRPLSEVERVVKFHCEEKTPNQSSRSQNCAKSGYKMTQLIDGRVKTKGDIHLNIRRYYCDPQHCYILRFEFWLNADALNLSCIRRYQRCMTQLAIRSFTGCCRANNRLGNLYMNQDFYGFISVKLANLPSYATRKTYPILSVQERRVNNCDISLELKNRRILPDGATEAEWLTSDTTKSTAKKSNESFLINHIRLYFNCILYQCLNLTPATYLKLAETGKFRSITLDNLLYLPGYTLINQHRLQSNLSQFEDHCLRRVAIVVLLIKLENRPFDDGEKMAALVKILLMSLAQNEYATAHKLIDDKTLQEVDPFQDESTGTSITRKIITEIELDSLKKFLNMFLIPKLDHWLPGLNENSTTETVNRGMTLSSLKLFKTALVQLKRRNKGCKVLVDPQTDTIGLKTSIEQYLCQIIIDHIRMRMEKIINTGGEPIKVGKVGNDKKNKPLSSDIEDDNMWLRLLHDMRYIQHDLTLYWSHKGLNSLLIHEQSFVKELGLFKKLEKMNLSSVIEAKLETYLKHQEINS